MDESEIGISILAKARIPGFSKTRLIPLLGEDGAAKLQARFIERTVETAREAAVGPITIWYTPTEWGEYFARYSCLSSVRLDVIMTKWIASLCCLDCFAKSADFANGVETPPDRCKRANVRPGIRRVRWVRP